MKRKACERSFFDEEKRFFPILFVFLHPLCKMN